MPAKNVRPVEIEDAEDPKAASGDASLTDGKKRIIMGISGFLALGAVIYLVVSLLGGSKTGADEDTPGDDVQILEGKEHPPDSSEPMDSLELTDLPAVMAWRAEVLQKAPLDREFVADEVVNHLEAVTDAMDADAAARLKTWQSMYMIDQACALGKCEDAAIYLQVAFRSMKTEKAAKANMDVIKRMLKQIAQYREGAWMALVELSLLLDKKPFQDVIDGVDLCGVFASGSAARSKGALKAKDGGCKCPKGATLVCPTFNNAPKLQTSDIRELLKTEVPRTPCECVDEKEDAKKAKERLAAAKKAVSLDTPQATIHVSDAIKNVFDLLDDELATAKPSIAAVLMFHQLFSVVQVDKLLEVNPVVFANEITVAHDVLRAFPPKYLLGKFAKMWADEKKGILGRFTSQARPEDAEALWTLWTDVSADQRFGDWVGSARACSFFVTGSAFQKGSGCQCSDEKKVPQCQVVPGPFERSFSARLTDIVQKESADKPCICSEPLKAEE